MGYSTSFSGTLKFTMPLTVEMLSEIDSLECIDSRDDPRVLAMYQGAPDPSECEWYYFDLEPTDDHLGLRWNGAEKTYDMVGQVNWLIWHMRKQWPNFGLSGKLEAQGEEPDDHWFLVIDDDGVAVHIDHIKENITCPNCGHKFES